MVYWKSLRRYLLPSPGAMALVWAALGVLILGTICTLTMFVSEPPEQPLVLAGFIASILVLPLCALLLIIGAFVDRRAGPRAGLLVLALVALGLAGAALAVAMALDPQGGAFLGLTSSVLLCAPVLLILSAVALFFLARAWPELRGVLHQERMRQAVELLSARGEASYAEISQELHMNVDEVDNLLDEILHSGGLEGALDPAGRRAYTSSALESKRRQLPGAIQSHGQITLADLSRQLGAPQSLIKEWIDELVGRGQFSGYINWQEGLLYSAEAEKLRALDGCPHCGGKLSLAGKGVIVCNYCGTEIFL